MAGLVGGLRCIRNVLLRNAFGAILNEVSTLPRIAAGPRLGDDFNPYREWLALAGDRPPNHYELLSLDPQEPDQARIAAAAARATTKVRSFRPGPHAQAWSHLLDEIQAAKACLGDPAKRAQYDAATL